MSSSSPPATHLLLVDAGNSRTKIGMFADQTCPPGRLPACLAEWTLKGSSAADWSEIGRRLESPSTTRLLITGSNPGRADALRRSLPCDWPDPTELQPRSEFPLTMDVDFPEKVGIDRLLNAIAANQVRTDGQAAVVISSGTATTVDYVAPDGCFCGGSILPGFELSARALHQYTELLPLIELDVVLDDRPGELGRNTEGALRSGLYWGHVGGVKELLLRLLHRGTSDQQAASDDDERHLGNIAAHEMPLVLLTGGAAPLLQPHLPSITRHEPHLPLQGLAVLATSCVQVD